MPVLPSEETAPGGITEKIAKDPSSNTESTASGHVDHVNENNPLGGNSAKASAQDFMSKGPQIAQDLPAKEGGKEELRKRMEELNK